MSCEDDRETYGEQRVNVLGWLNGEVVHLTDDGDTMRAISLRKAEKHEVRRYVQEIAR